MADSNDNKNDDNNDDDTDVDTYIKTTTHNYVSRRAIIDGAKQVEIRGRSIIHEKVKVRGDLSIIKIGRYVEIGSSTLLEPSYNPYNQDNDNNNNNNNKKYIPMIIGSHTHIGKECTIQAAAIGSMVWIGDNVKIGERCIIKDNCIIESNIVLGNDTVIPPFTLLSSSNNSSNSSTRSSSNNNNTYEELPPSVAVTTQEVSLDRYSEFKQEQRNKQ